MSRFVQLSPPHGISLKWPSSTYTPRTLPPGLRPISRAFSSASIKEAALTMHTPKEPPSEAKESHHHPAGPFLRSSSVLMRNSLSVNALRTLGLRSLEELRLGLLDRGS